MSRNLFNEMIVALRKAERAIRMSFQVDNIYVPEMEPALEALQKVLLIEGS